MNLHEILTRLELLNIALFNDSQLKEVGRTGYFTVGERISINQERGYLYSLRSYIDRTVDVPLREYKVSAWIEQKIRKNHE